MHLYYFLVWLSFAFAAVPTALFIFNLSLYRRPKPIGGCPQIAVLIPARNEESSIEECLRCVLTSRGALLDVFVLDDHSEDATANIVARLAERDGRVHLVRGPALPTGWCGKQHACAVLGRTAEAPLLCFLDADVRLEPGCLAAMAGELECRRAALLSGFPLQQTGTILERMLIPQMHFILLGFLPIALMRKSPNTAFSAGCGQIMLVRREAYLGSGGHTAIRSSRHDGISLPRVFRQAGFLTDLCDLTELAHCRMYRSGNEVIAGLLKNATEGLAAPSRILPFTFMLIVGQVLPLLLLALHPTLLASLAVFVLYTPRLLAVIRFRQSPFGALLHPTSIIILLAIQWVALIRSALGHPSVWKGRSYHPGAAS